MINADELYARLSAGETPDMIAQEMTKALNDAQNRVLQEEEEAKMREKANSIKMTLAENVFNAISEYCTTVLKMDTLPCQFEDPQSCADYIEMTAAVTTILEPLVGTIKVEVSEPEPAPVAEKKASFEDVMADFFKAFGI